MAELNGLPPEETLPEETPAPLPGVFPPPEEGASRTAAAESSERRRGGTAARQSMKNALLLAVAGVTLCGAIYTAPMEPAPTPEPETVLTEPVTPPPATPTPTPAPTPAVTEPPAARTAAERLVAAGTWKNSAEDEWVHFNGDGTGWWYDGTYFGRMAWQETADGGVSYEASIAYLGPERNTIYDWVQEKDGDTLHYDDAGGSIVLSDKDRFTCPGLRYGEGAYLPDDTPIDASVMDGVLGKSNLELVAGTSWHMVEFSDLLIPEYVPDGEVVYDDVIYVQSLDFAAGILRFAIGKNGFLVRENESSGYAGEDGSKSLDVSFTLNPDEAASVPVYFYIYLPTDFGIHYLRRCIPGDAQYNIDQGGWTVWVNSEGAERIYPLFTALGLRLGIKSLDWCPHNYTILAMD